MNDQLVAFVTLLCSLPNVVRIVIHAQVGEKVIYGTTILNSVMVHN